MVDNYNIYRFLFNHSLPTQSSHVAKTQIDRTVRHTPLFIPIHTLNVEAIK